MLRKVLFSSARAVSVPRFAPVESSRASVFRAFSTTPHKISIVRHPVSINGQPLEDVTPPNEKFAVVEFSGTQFKLAIDDVLIANRMDEVDIGDNVNLDKVLMVGSRKATLIGQPVIPGAVVRVCVEEKAKDKKVIIFKMRRRKNSKRIRGFRRQVTVLRVTDIILPDSEGNIL